MAARGRAPHSDPGKSRSRHLAAIVAVLGIASSAAAGATYDYDAPGRIVVASQGASGSATTPTANLRAAALTGRSSAEASAGAVRLFRALPAAKAGGQTLTGLIGFEEGPPAMVPTGAEGPLPTTGPGFQFRGGIGGRAKTSASRGSASWTRRHDTDGAWST